MTTVLVADDSLLYLRLAGRVLTDAGCHVLLVRSGHELLRAARIERPDVVFCDLLMPDGDGLTALRGLRDDPALHDVPVYLLTGMEDQDSLDAGLAAGATGVLTKPFAPETLIAIMARHRPGG